MNALCRYSIQHPARVCVIAVAVTLATAPGVTKLTLRTGGHALVPTDAPEMDADDIVRARFGVLDPIVVVIESDHPRGVYNLKTLDHVRHVTERLRELDGVRDWDVASLATEKGDRVYPGSLRFRPLLDPFPENDADLDRIRDDVRAIQLYTGTVVSSDERAAAIFVGVPEAADRTEMYRAVRAIVDDRDVGIDRASVIGAPVAEALLGTHILEDLGVPPALLGQSLDSDESAAELNQPTGWGAARKAIARHIGLVPVAIAIIAVVFWVKFRSVAAMLLPLSEVGACLVLTFAVMGWCSVPIYLTTAVLPVILTVIGIADEIHIFHRYRDTLGEYVGGDHRDAVRRTMDEMWRPVAKTSITTAVGFLSFALSPIAPVRAFGVFTALGIVLCMVWSLTVIPALLAMIPPGLFSPGAKSEDLGPRPRLARWCEFVTRNRRAVIVAACCIVVLAPFGISRLRVQDSWIDGFAPSTPFHRAMRMFNERFLGMHTLLISFDTGRDVLTGTLSAEDIDHHRIRIPLSDFQRWSVDDSATLVSQRLQLRPDGGESPVRAESERRRSVPRWSTAIESVTVDGNGAIVTFPRRAGSPKLAHRQWNCERVRLSIAPHRFKQPETLRRVADFETFLSTHVDTQVGGTLGPASYIATASFMERARQPGSRAIPETTDRLGRLWFNYGRIRGEERLRQVVDADYASGLISVFLKNANFLDTRRLMDRIRAYEREHLSPHGVTLTFSGDVAVSQALIRGIVSTQVRSLLLSLGGILLVATLFARSIATGLLCVLPCAFAVLLNFAVMGWMGIPLGVATSMFAGMTLGIGIDYAIHLLERLRFARERGMDDSAALADAVAATGPAIGIDALAVALGFGVMTLSQVPANARLGGLLVLSIAGCLAATLLLLPAILAGFARPQPSSLNSA